MRHWDTVQPALVRPWAFSPDRMTGLCSLLVALRCGAVPSTRAADAFGVRIAVFLEIGQVSQKKVPNNRPKVPNNRSAGISFELPDLQSLVDCQ